MSNATSDFRVVALSTSDIGNLDHCILSERAPHAQASAAATAGFDYAALPPADAEDLHDRAGRLQGLFKKLSANIIVIGRDLIEVKDRLAHGQFENWIERELGVGIRAAQYYMGVAKFTEGKSETVALLPPSTLRILAAKSAPPEIVEQVIARAGSGDVVPDDAVREMIRTDRTVKRQAKQEAAQAKTEKRKSKAARAARAAEEEAWRAAREREQAKIRATAQSIIGRFSQEDVGFLADLTFDVVLELRLLLAERSAAFGQGAS
jgi:hypothetical protein